MRPSGSMALPSKPLDTMIKSGRKRRTAGITTFDQASQLKLLADVDKQAWADASSATLFQFPDINAWSSKIQGVSDNPLSPAIFWNFANWTIKK